MPATSSWRSLASGAASKAREYISGSRPVAGANDQANRQTWEQWARQKWNRSRSWDELAAASGVETVSLFPGWATKQYPPSEKQSNNAVQEFSLEVSISGYATALRAPEFASRSERALMRLARGFAALPKLPDQLASTSVPPSPRLEAVGDRRTEDPSKRGLLLNISGPIADEPLADEHLSTESDTPPRSDSPDPADFPVVPPTTSEDVEALAGMDNLALFHSNLESRLRPFWAQPLSNRIVRLSLYLQNRDESEEPLFTQDVLTSPQGGAFNVQFRVPFERMCTHPRGIQLAFGEIEEHRHVVVVHAHLLPPPPRAATPAAPGVEKPLPLPPATQIEAEIPVPLSSAKVRVISDIDDTVKNSGVLTGARSLFRNVFVRPLEHAVIRSMSNWYTAMYDRGVKFHYVSNGPFEMLSVVKDFLTLARLPPGSVKLKYYATRSMFNWMSWEPAGERKRAGVVELLDSFPTSKFILIGDTGELDLELYAALARERPSQILAVYVRDVSTAGASPLSNPAPRPRQVLDEELGAARKHAFKSTGDLATSALMAMTMQPGPSPGMVIGAMNARRPPQKAMTDPQRFTASAPMSPMSRSRNNSPPSSAASSSPPSRSSSPRFTSRSATMEVPGALPSPSTPIVSMTPAERRRVELQARLERAREIIPRHIVLRAFREPEECVEVWDILETADQEISETATA